MKITLAKSTPMGFVFVGGKRVGRFDPIAVTKTDLEKSEYSEDDFDVIEDKEVKSESEEEPDVDDLEITMSIKGIGKETAEEILQVYGDYDTFLNEATEEELVNVSGIGKKRAKSIMNLL